LPWQNLAADTDTHAVHTETDTRRPRNRGSSLTMRALQLPQAEQTRRRRWWIIGLAVAAAGALLVTLLGWGFLGGEPPARDSNRLYVTRSGREHAFPTVLAAVNKARAGDHIILLDDSWEEEFPPLNSAKNLTLRAEEGKTVKWRMPHAKHESKQF